jgi:K+-transporting ATPase c subunit
MVNLLVLVFVVVLVGGAAFLVATLVPDAWLQAVTNGLVVATISGVISGVSVAWITRRT